MILMFDRVQNVPPLSAAGTWHKTLNPQSGLTSTKFRHILIRKRIDVRAATDVCQVI